MNIKISFTDNAVSEIADKGFDENYGQDLSAVQYRTRLKIRFQSRCSRARSRAAQ